MNFSTTLQSSARQLFDGFDADERWTKTPLFLFALAVLTSYLTSRRKKRNYPPGPPGIPFFGNLFQMSQEAWFQFTEWKKTYGDVIFLKLASQPVVVLNSHKAAADLLDRRAGIYSDRPRWIVASEILTGGLLVVFTPYGDIWRRMRRAAHEGLNKSVVSTFQDTQFKEAVLLTHGILTSPKYWNENVRRAAASMVLSVVYDSPHIKSEHDPRISRINDFVGRLVRAAWPGAHFVEFFPWMKHMPNWLPSWMVKWKTEAEEWYRRDSEMFEGMYNEVRSRMDAGEDRPSFTASLIRDAERNNISEREQAWLSATMYAAGAETTAGVLAWFMAAMLRYPEVQKRAHEELDRVIGRSRMPTFADRNDLPYINACVREALRWHPVDPVGLLHKSTRDDVYEGYFIPKGTIVIANVWGLNRDKEAYGEDADHFNPGRFIDADGGLKPALADTKDEGHVTFGFGRRLCVGRHVATNSLFIDIACLLWTATIAPVKDAQGCPILPDVDNTINDGLVVRPLPFDCDIRYRFPEAESIVAQTVEIST